MSGDKHTVGPWEYHKSAMIVMDESGQMSVCDIRGFGSLQNALGCEGAAEVMDANGRLIAAAPDLLKSLRELVSSTGDKEAVAGAVAVIRKATGKEE